MMQQQNDKMYSAADIKRYHNGGMPPAEMHALEKAALDDPFLSDAIDGFAQTETPAADVQFLKEQLQNRIGKVVFLNHDRRLFLSVAAMAVLLAGFGWLAYNLSGNNEQDIAVQTEKATPYKQAPLPQASVADSVRNAASETIIITNASDKKEEKTVAKKEAKTKELIEQNETASVTNQTKINDKDIVADRETFSKPQSAAPFLKSEKGIPASRASDNVFKARIVDAQNNAVPFATVTNQQDKAIHYTDTAGNLTVQAPDSSVSVAINSTGFEPQQAILNRADSEATIVMQRGNDQLSEVVVTAMGRRKVGHNNVRLEAVEPLEGRSRFDRYIDQNFTAPEELEMSSGKKEVVLSFDVDNDGNAVNISVEKSLCVSCDAAAVSLIQKGSKWKKTKKSGKARAYIKF